MSKYLPLERYLKSKGGQSIPMSFDEIETVIGDALPPSARKHRAWWSNNPSNSVITYAWLAAGYKSTDVNLEGEKVVFRKGEVAPVEERQLGLESHDQHPLFGCMAHTVTLAEGADLTEPAAPDWAAQSEDPTLHNA